MSKDKIPKKMTECLICSGTLRDMFGAKTGGAYCDTCQLVHYNDSTMFSTEKYNIRGNREQFTVTLKPPDEPGQYAPHARAWMRSKRTNNERKVDQDLRMIWNVSDEIIDEMWENGGWYRLKQLHGLK